MPAEQSEAIVLRVVPWSETSLIASIYTRDFGKLSVVAKGARRPKSPFEAALDLLSICRVVFIPKSADALDILTEAKLQQRFRGGSRDLLRLYAGYYVSELLERMTDKGDKQPEIFDLAVATLQALADESNLVAAIVLRWELQLLRLVGHLPSWRQCAQCNRVVEDSSWYFFSPLAGGILCLECQAGGRQLIRLSPDVRTTVEEFSRVNWRDLNLATLGQGPRGALRRLMTRYLTVMLDRKLHMHVYLEELGR